MPLGFEQPLTMAERHPELLKIKFCQLWQHLGVDLVLAERCRKCRMRHLRQNAESGKMPSDAAWALILAILLAARSALSSMPYEALRNLRSSSGGRKRASLPFSGAVLASAASLSAR